MRTLILCIHWITSLQRLVSNVSGFSHFSKETISLRALFHGPWMVTCTVQELKYSIPGIHIHFATFFCQVKKLAWAISNHVTKSHVVQPKVLLKQTWQQWHHSGRGKVGVATHRCSWEDVGICFNPCYHLYEFNTIILQWKHFTVTDLAQNYAKWEDIDLLIVFLTSEHFWCHPIWRPNHCHPDTEE